MDGLIEALAGAGRRRGGNGRLRSERVSAGRHRRQCHRDRQACGNGAGRLYRPCHHRRRGARRRLGARAGGKRAGRCQALCQPGVRHDAGHGRKLGNGQFLAAASRSRRQGARRARGRRCQAVEHRARGARRRQGSDHPRRHAAACDVRILGSRGPFHGRSRQGRAQGPAGFQVDRATCAAGGRSGQVRRQCAIHVGHRIPRHARGFAPACAAVRGDGAGLRRDGRLRGPRGGQNRASAARNRRDRQQFLGRQARPRRSRGELGREPCREAQLGRADGRLSAPRRAARTLGAQAGRCRRRPARRGAHDLRRLRVSLPGACPHGAPRCGGQAHRGQLRNLGGRPVPNHRPIERRKDLRPHARAGHHSHALCGRQLRPARQRVVRFHRRGGLDREGARCGRYADQTAVDARRRHRRGSVSTHVLPQARGGAERARRAQQLEARHRRPVHHEPALRSRR